MYFYRHTQTSINYPNPIKPKTEYWNQLFCYALLILLNHSALLAKIKGIKLEVWGYHRKDTIKESLIRKEKFIQEIKGVKGFKKDINVWINEQLGEEFTLSSSSSLFINPKS